MAFHPFRIVTRQQHTGYFELIETHARILLDLTARARDVEAKLQATQRQNARLSREANSDVLTNLPNRRAYERVLCRETERARRATSEPETHLTMLLIDLDRLKQLNTVNRPLADQVLIQIGKALTSSRRPMDFVGRLAGDEFVVLLPGCNTQNAAAEAEVILSAIRQIALPGLPAGAITATIGAGSMPEDANTGETLYAVVSERL